MLNSHIKILRQLLVIAVLIFTNLSFAQPDIPPADFDGSPNVWQLMRDEFRIKFNANRREIRAQIRWFQNNQHYLYKTLESAGPLISYIHQQTLNRDMPAELVLIPFIESEYHTSANSRCGAAGLWQFMPKTGNAFGMRINWWYDDRLDIEKATSGALSYLDYLNQFFEGDWLLAIAAYDSGEGTVLNAVRHNEACGRNTFFWHLHLPHETKSYIPKLLALVAIIRDPDYYGMSLPDIRSRPYFQDVEVPPHLPLSAVAGLAETEIDTLLNFNPEFKQLTTGPRTNVHVLLPIDKAALFRSNLALNPTVFKHTWLYHTVLIGESLSVIAQKHHTTVAMLKKVNNLPNTRIYQKQKLLVPNQHLAVPQAGAHVTYFVKSGDSLNRIAHRYQTTAKKLRAQNGLTGDIIHPGTILIIR